MNQHGLGDVADLQPGGDRQRNDTDELGRMASDDGATQHHTGERVTDDFDEPTRVVVDEGLGAGTERHLGDTDLASQCKRVGFGQTNIGDLGFGEDGAGRLVIVQVAVLTGMQTHHMLGHFAALHGCHRRQGQLAADVTCSIDMGHIGDAVLVDADVSARVHIHAQFRQSEVLGVGHGANGQHSMTGPHHPPVVATDHHAAAVGIALDGLGPRPLQ